MGVFPDFGGLGGIGDLRAVVGALLTLVLIVAVLVLIVSAIVWAIAAANGNYSAAGKGRKRGEGFREGGDHDRLPSVHWSVMSTDTATVLRSSRPSLSAGTVNSNPAAGEVKSSTR